MSDGFIPHGQGCEALMFSPDDHYVRCNDPATHTVEADDLRYVCTWHYKNFYGPTTWARGRDSQ